MKYNGAEIIVKLLEREGITKIAGIPGGANLPIYDALYKSRIEHVLARHEQGAGFIAQGMARVTGKAAVCLATSGPGATNLITAIADARLDSIPIIVLTGQVSTSLLGTDAFQEVDTYGLTLPITKHNFLVRSAKELIKVIPEAFKIAESGRPGPVAIDIPKDVQLEEVEINEWPKAVKKEKFHSLDNGRIRRAAGMINESEKPLLYIGGGIIHSNACRELYELAKKNSIPVASTLMGLGSFPSDDPLYLGMLGMHGARFTNLVINEADLLLALGVRFDDRATGNIKKFCPRAKIIHIDIDRAEIDKIKKAHFSITADIGAALKGLIPYINSDRRRRWLVRIKEIKKRYPFIMTKSQNPLHPVNLIRNMSGMVTPETIIVTDVGQHQMWAAQVYPFKKPRTWLTSGGLGTMGFGLPAAIGAALECPDKRIICISGDGSFLMNIQELATLADLNLKVTIIIINNGHLGLVRQQQELFYGGRYIGSKFKTNPDFTGIARDFGIQGYDLAKTGEPMRILSRALAEDGPGLINVPIHYAEKVMPIVPPGAGNYEMIGGDSDE